MINNNKDRIMEYIEQHTSNVMFSAMFAGIKRSFIYETDDSIYIDHDINEAFMHVPHLYINAVMLVFGIEKNTYLISRIIEPRVSIKTEPDLEVDINIVPEYITLDGIEYRIECMYGPFTGVNTRIRLIADVFHDIEGFDKALVFVLNHINKPYPIKYLIERDSIRDLEYKSILLRRLNEKFANDETTVIL